MTPLQERNEKLGRKIVKNLKRRNIEGFYCPTAAEAIALVNGMIADGSSVTWGGSMTLRDMGLTASLHARGTLHVLDRDLAQTPAEVQDIYRRAFESDVYLTSANALSEDGVIVNVDGNGNRIAAISWGPKKVIFVVGINKVAPTVADAIARARGIASPINAQRFDIATPCRVDGSCHNCTSPESVCSYIHLLRNCRNEGRHAVVLVGEPLGY